MKNKAEFSKEIRNLIGQGKTLKALSAFEAANELYNLDILDEITLLKSTFSLFTLNSVKGILENESVEEQKVSGKILQLLNYIENDNTYIKNNRYDKIPQNELVRAKLKEKITDYYNSIYWWHKDKAKKDFYQNFGFDIAVSRWGAKYFYLAKSIKSIENASLEEIVQVAKEVINGRLGWSSKELDNHTYSNLYKNAYGILYLTENATMENMPFFEDFEKEAKRILLEKDDTLFKIEYGVDPYKKLGGLTTVLTLNKYRDDSHIYTPFLLGLQESDKEDDIVMLIKANKIRIINMEFNYANFEKENKAKLVITIQNDTQSTINGHIRKGQLFEDAKKTLNFQVLAACADSTFSTEGYNKTRIALDVISLTPQLDVISSKDGLISCFYFEEKSLNKQAIESYFDRWVGLNQGFLKRRRTVIYARFVSTKEYVRVHFSSFIRKINPFPSLWSFTTGFFHNGVVFYNRTVVGLNKVNYFKLIKNIFIVIGLSTFIFAYFPLIKAFFQYIFGK